MEISEFLQEHWLSVFMASYLIGMMLYGHYRGFLRLSISMAALAISLLIVRAAMPQATGFVKSNEGIRRWMEGTMMKAAGLEHLQEYEVILPAEQRAVIEGTKLPEMLKQALIENNNEEIYHILGVDAFAEYIGSYLADRIINTLSFILLFLMVYIGIRLLAYCLDLIARLPILYGLNQIAGAALGLIQALAYFWISCLALNLFAHTGWGLYLLDTIEATPWISFLYHNNLLLKAAAGIFWNII